MTIYQIEFKKYNSFYPFFNSEKCVEEFLQNVKYKFHATSKKWFKYSFIIKNTQNSIRPDLQPLLKLDIGQLKLMIAFILMILYFMH